jgi:uncharacterized membrane protein
MLLSKTLQYLSNNRKLAVLAFVSILSVALLTLRVLVTKEFTLIFLTWNLFLAWTPLFFIKWVWEREKAKPQPALTLAVCFTVWLLLFPNAPYIITDLKHLRGVPDDMIWFDTLMIFMFATAGFMTGMYSIRIVHRILKHRWDEKIIWATISMAMVLSGFGIFLGRYGRWNSWDIVTQPIALLKGAAASARDPFAIKYTISFSLVLILMYFAFHIFAESKQHETADKHS